MATRRLNIADDGMRFALPADVPLLAGPSRGGGNAIVDTGDARPRVAVVGDASTAPTSADLVMVRAEALAGRGADRVLRRARRRARGALIAAPPSPDGPFDRRDADVVVVRASADSEQAARDALRTGVRAGGRPVLVDVARAVPADAVVAALDAGAAGAVFATGDPDADARLLAEVGERDRRRLDEAPEMTVAICVRNGGSDLDRCLASLQSLRHPRYEILVVDDGSTDASVAIARRHGARVIELGEDGGLGRARNTAIQEARGEYVAFLDSDEEADPLWLARLWRLLDRLGAAGAGGPNRPFPDAGLQERAVGGAPGVAMPVVRADGTCTHVPTCNLVIRADVARAVDGFHEQLPVLGEDLDFCYRVLDAGHDLLLHPTAWVHHHRRRSITGYLRQMHAYGRFASAMDEARPNRIVDIDTELPVVRRLDPRRPHPCFVGPQASQRYNLAFAPLTNGFPLKMLLATAAGTAAAAPIAARAGRLHELLALGGVAVAGQLAYVVARVPVQPGARGVTAIAARLLTAGLWYAGPCAVGTGRYLSRTPEMPRLVAPAEPAG